MKVYLSPIIANDFIRLDAKRSTDEKKAHEGLDIMKMLKLCFLSHGWHLALYNQPLFADRIEAWPYGPVAIEVYNHFRHQGIYIKYNDQDTTNIEITETARKVIDAVWEKYGNMHAYTLSNITHQENSPWTVTVKENGLYAQIKDAVIKSYYKALMK